MFSLGILFFEMCWPAETRMERALLLRAARERKYPSEFARHLRKQHRLCDLCLRLNPSKRPSAQELLHSDLIPEEIGKEQEFTEALRVLSDRNSVYFTKTLNSLFRDSMHKEIDDTTGAPSLCRHNQLYNATTFQQRAYISNIETSVRNLCTYCFELYGGRCFRDSTLVPVPSDRARELQHNYNSATSSVPAAGGGSSSNSSSSSSSGGSSSVVSSALNSVTSTVLLTREGIVVQIPSNGSVRTRLGQYIDAELDLFQKRTAPIRQYNFSEIQYDRGDSFHVRTMTGTQATFDIVYPKVVRIGLNEKEKSDEDLIDATTLKVLAENIALTGEISELLSTGGSGSSGGGGSGGSGGTTGVNNNTKSVSSVNNTLSSSLVSLGSNWCIRMNAANLETALWLGVGVTTGSVVFHRLRRLVRKFGMGASAGWNLLLAKIQEDGLLASGSNGIGVNGSNSSSSSSSSSSTNSTSTVARDASPTRGGGGGNSISNHHQRQRSGSISLSEQSELLDDASLRVLRTWVEHRHDPTTLVKQLERRLKATNAWALAQRGVLMLEKVRASVRDLRVSNKVQLDALAFPRLQSTFMMTQSLSDNTIKNDGIYFESGFIVRKKILNIVEGGMYLISSHHKKTQKFDDIGAIGITVHVQKIIKWNVDQFMSLQGVQRTLINMVFLCTAGIYPGVDVLVDRLRADGIRAMCSDGTDPSMEGQMLMASQVQARFVVEISRDESFKLIDHHDYESSTFSSKSGIKKRPFKDFSGVIEFVKRKM